MSRTLILHASLGWLADIHDMFIRTFKGQVHRYGAGRLVMPFFASLANHGDMG